MKQLLRTTNKLFYRTGGLRQRPKCRAAMLKIDGAQGEGGGQVLRSALALALVTGQPFRIDNIRARRPRPGLLPQHLTAVEAAARVGQATVHGAARGSTWLEFAPQTVRPGSYEFQVGTAGSTTLVLQTVLPALLTAAAPSRLVLTGGTHNPFAPPFDFLQLAFLPLLARLGPKVDVTLEAPGFYPAGGGCLRATITPVPRLTPLTLLERGALRHCAARALVSRLPRQIGERELRVVQQSLNWPEEALQVQEVTARGPGNVLVLLVASEQVTEVFTAFGKRGVRAEDVARTAVGAVRRYLEANVPVGEYLADQLLLPWALAGGGAFRTLTLSSHARTNIDVLRMFLDCKIRITPEGPDTCLVTVGQ